MAGIGQKISTTDYNNLQSDVELILGSSSAGTPTYGYGQQVRSSQVDSNDKVSVNDIDNLRTDLINIGVHQTGSVPLDAGGTSNLTTVSTGQKITYNATDQPFDQYVSYTSSRISGRFDINSSYLSTTLIDTISRFYDPDQGQSWGSGDTGIETVISLSWTSNTAARQWFNSGGKILFRSTRTDGTDTIGDSQSIGPQNAEWSSFLDTTVGTQQFLASAQTSPTNGSDFYRLTGSYQNFVTLFKSGAYSASYFQIAARTPGVSSNSTGTASTIDFRVRWIDDHVPILDSPVDGVDGLISLFLSVSEPIQTLLPSGNWTVESPVISNTPTIVSVDPP